MKPIACLHTADSNIAVFESARAALGWPEGRLIHHVRPDLLAAAEAAGGLTGGLAVATRAVLAELRTQAPVVLLTCSTLGPAVAGTALTFLRTDAALARAAVAEGGRVAVLCAVASTLAATGDLFRAAARSTGASIDLQLVEGAWDLFKAGRRDLYLQVVAQAADQARRDGAYTVALAQASMAGASELTRLAPQPLTSPLAGLTAAGAILEAS